MYNLGIFRRDFSASIVVFFVALPLCLGIALASGAPLFSGIIAGIIGGIVVGIFSSSPLGVSGPAAGLVTIIAAYMAALSGSWQAFLSVIVIAGVIQIFAGVLRLGTIAYYFPTSVIKGMLAGIGILIFLKQIPYIINYKYDSVFELFSPNIVNLADFSTLIVALISIAILVSWDSKFLKQFKVAKIIQGPVVVVLLGILIYHFSLGSNAISFTDNQMVRVFVPDNLSGFFGQFVFADFSHIRNPEIYVMALVLALVASIETLLCVEATDKLDPKKRITHANQELRAQGIGNIISGMIGGLPITQVIVRSSANVNFGAQTKVSTILHGFLLFASAIFIPNILNMIPLVSLASILLIIGYKLAKPQTFKEIYKLGNEHFFPFVITVVCIVALDLLKGVSIGLLTAVLFILANHLKNSYHKVIDQECDNTHIIELAEEISFLNKGGILQMLNAIPDGSKVIINGSKSRYIHHDVLEILQDYKVSCRSKKIKLELIGININK